MIKISCSIFVMTDFCYYWHKLVLGLTGFFATLAVKDVCTSISDDAVGVCSRYLFWHWLISSLFLHLTLKKFTDWLHLTSPLIHSHLSTEVIYKNLSNITHCSYVILLSMISVYHITRKVTIGTNTNQCKITLDITSSKFLLIKDRPLYVQTGLILTTTFFVLV